MISTTLTKNITNITELKKNPVELAKHSETCVLSNGRPCFYALSAERMAELLEAESFRKLASDELESIYESLDHFKSAMVVGSDTRTFAPIHMQHIEKSLDLLINEAEVK